MNHTSKPQKLLTGLAIGESPRWHDGRLWFANWTTPEIIAVDTKGKSEVVVHLGSNSFPVSIDWLPDGRLVVSGREGLFVQETDGSLKPYGDPTSLAGKGWNEIVVDGRGNTYINGATFDPTTAAFGPGHIALVTPDGRFRQVADDIRFPNGMAVTPDNSTLVIAESHGNKLTAFDIAADGGLFHRRVWADAGVDSPDGICFDAEGAIWYADVASSRCVRIQESGKVLQDVQVDRGCFACMLGGPDHKTLFILAAEWHGFNKMVGAPKTGQVLTVNVSSAGAGWPARTNKIKQSEE